MIRATLHYFLVMCCRVSCHIPNDTFYFCLSSHTNDVMITFIFLGIVNLKLIFRLLFFEHGYLTLYSSPRNKILLSYPQHSP